MNICQSQFLWKHCRKWYLIGFPPISQKGRKEALLPGIGISCNRSEAEYRHPLMDEVIYQSHLHLSKEGSARDKANHCCLSIFDHQFRCECRNAAGIFATTQ